MNIATSDLALKFIWVQVQMVISLFVGPTIFVLVLEYVRPEKQIRKRNIALLLVVPVISTLFVLSSPYHQFFRYNFRVDYSNSLTNLLSDKGPVFWISQSYIIGLVLVSCVILAIKSRNQKIYSPNPLLLLLGIFIPFMIRAFYLFGITPIPGLEVTSLSFVITGGLYTWALVGFHLFDVVPLARNELMDHMQDLVFVLDMHGHIVDFNQAAQSAFGLPKRLTTHILLEALPPDWIKLFERYQDTVDLAEEVVIGSGDHQHAYDLTISAIRDKQEHILGRLFLLHNLTKRKKIENALFIKDRAIESSLDAMTISNLDGVLTYVNPAFLRLWGYQDKSEVLNRNVRDFWNKPEDVEKIARELNEQGGWAGEAVARRKNGSIFDVNISASVISDLTGKPSAMLASFVDITEQKKAREIAQFKLKLSDFAATHSLQEVMQNALDEIEKVTGSTISFYHLIAPDQTKVLLQAWSTRTLQEFCEIKSMDLHYDIKEAGVWIDCIKQGGPVIHNDFSSLPHRKGFPAGHVDIIRELVVPIFRMDHTVSVLGVGNKPSDYDQIDVELTTRIADIIWDITERKRVETENLRLSSFPQLNPNPVLEVDENGKITFYNQAALNILKSQGLNDPRIFLPSDLDIVRTLKDGNAVIVSREIRIRDITVEETLHFAQEFNSVRIYANDITERKKAEEKLSQLSRAVEQSPASIVITDLSGAIEYVNPKFTQATGYSFEEVRGKNPRILNSGKTPTEIYPKMWDALLAGKEWRGEFINRRKNGELYYESAILSPIVDPNGVVTHYLAVKEDITERKEAEERIQLANEKLQIQLEQIQGLQAILREQAIRDPLTGLYNRRFLNETLERELARAKRDGYQVSFVMIDIDHFKNVNDKFGHDAGDLILQNLSAQLLNHTRSSDIVCRYGGEEFLLLLPNTSTESAFQSAERWREVFQDSKLTWEDTEIRTTLSLGVATFPIHGNSRREILSAADSAMYLAKSQGRNCVVISGKNQMSSIFNNQDKNRNERSQSN